ncbi:MAG: carbohydrate porin [Deltaproteobacteria bacterium]|nr:carbohydrate porin [Deltaproteobacteria bacterium]
MNLLTRYKLHDIHDESWNAYGQLTYISSLKLPFSAAYTNANGSTNSLLTGREHSFTASATFFLGVRLWTSAEGYFVPEVIAERPLSSLRGIGGSIQNFELQKGGSVTPQIYRSRSYLQQTIGLGGKRVVKTSDPMQLGSVVDSRRLVLRAGNFSILDFLDKNSFAGDLRQQFFNMAFLTYAAYDFGSDARGFSYGGVAELYWDDWALRFGRISLPKDPNQLSADFRLDKHYGDQVEVEHTHKLGGRAGAVRILGYRNRGRMGRFDDAIAAYRSDPGKNATTCPGFNYGSENANAPDLCWVRKANTKLGIGINVEQYVSDDIGLFLRGMISDGKSEVYAYTPTDRSLAFGLLSRGSAWGRPRDLAGTGVGLAWISGIHAEYLRMGGIDGFVGDGNLRLGTESVFEVFYSVNLLSSAWLSGDYQHITNPAFNKDRGPVDIFGARFHAEF